MSWASDTTAIINDTISNDKKTVIIKSFGSKYTSTSPVPIPTSTVVETATVFFQTDADENGLRRDKRGQIIESIGTVFVISTSKSKEGHRMYFSGTSSDYFEIENVAPYAGHLQLTVRKVKNR